MEGNYSWMTSRYNFSSPQAARKLGISTVFQELSLIPQMTVAENIWLTREPLAMGVVDRKADRAGTAGAAGAVRGHL